MCYYINCYIKIEKKITMKKSNASCFYLTYIRMFSHKKIYAAGFTGF